MASNNWREISLQILNELEERLKRKLDKVERCSFLIMLSQNVERLMKERSYFGSKSEFVEGLRDSHPKEYRKLVRRSLNPEADSQKGHSFLKKRTRESLERKGYEVYDIDKKQERENAVKRLRAANEGYLVAICQQGKERYPDFVAFKGSECLVVEVTSRKNRVVRQLYYDQMAGKTLLVLPVPVNNLELWGPSQVFEGPE